MRSPAVLLVFFLLSGCLSKPDPMEVAGIALEDDGVFRQSDFGSVDPDRVFDQARRIIRVHFAGGRVIEDPDNRTIEVPPRGFYALPRRIQVFLRVIERQGNSVVEIFCKVDELRDDPIAHPDDPWHFLGRDAELENRLLHEIWNGVVVVPQVQG